MSDHTSMSLGSRSSVPSHKVSKASKVGKNNSFAVLGKQSPTQVQSLSFQNTGKFRGEKMTIDAMDEANFGP